MKGKIKVLPVILGVLIVITVLLSFKMFRQTMEYDDRNRVEFGDLYPVEIDGLYSEEGGPWKPLTRETEFDILSYRDITVRGHFNRDVPEGEKLFLKIELVHAALRVNGQELLNISRDEENGNPFKARGYFWVAVESPGITTEDTVELNFGNFYWNGYKSQFDELLWNMKAGEELALLKDALRQDAGILVIGLVFSGLTLFLLIGALLCTVLRIQGAVKFLWLGLVTLSSVLWFWTLSPALAFAFPWPVSLGVLYVVSIQGIAIFVILFIFSNVSGWRKKAMLICLCSLLAELIKDIVMYQAGIVDIYDSINFSMVIDLGAAVCSLICLFYECYWLKKQEIRCLLRAMLPLAAGGILELVNGYVQFTVEAVCWGIGLVIFTILEGINTLLWVRQKSESEKQILKLENEMTQTRISSMLSQIQPHFLFNALTTIRYLCDYQPEKASVAVDDFSQYLRGNMVSLTQKAPVTFDQELDHLKHYLSLEQMRFENITVIYDLKATGFLLPVLTIQPLVENAIRHGITKREEGGTITLSTREDENHWTIQIKDDGIGFDPEEEKKDGRIHVGIQNVRRRIADMCGGSLQVESTPGVGTTVTIVLPRNP
ncbi:sensor histidine kinase [Diplocloster agilis]|uniref:sensor histidine kinase n=1 Tax=Diplocloster agilis TaxID=2850323 RepID=UPI00082131DB|nr:histidine kinase [Suonthocola fibrivorans]MCU6736905.1 histidine kinase [Suonthocola fibrivorans]SCJ94381.1 Inner membrane protein ypdA [uncultured Clostridium sp.]